MKLDKSKDGWRSTRAKYVYLFVGGMVVSRMLGTPEPQTREVVKEVPVTTTITKTPEACKRALAIDNEIFTRVGQALGEYLRCPARRSTWSVSRMSAPLSTASAWGARR